MLIYIGANTVSKTLRMNFGINRWKKFKDLKYEPKSWSTILKSGSLLKGNSATMIKSHVKPTLGSQIKITLGGSKIY